MKSSSPFILLIISTFIVHSQDTQKNQLNKKNQKIGDWVGYHEETNTVRYKGNFIDDKPVGLFTYFAKEGHVSGKVNFINDSLSSSEILTES